MATVVTIFAAVGCGDISVPRTLPPAVAREAAPPPPNVLLVTLDTTRADRIGAYNAALSLTPAVDELAATGVRFAEAFTPSPITLPAHATIHTGLQPPEHGLRLNGEGRLGSAPTTMAEALRARGYRTGAFVAAFVLDSRFGLDRGFDVYDDDDSDALPQDFPEELSRYRPGNVVVDRALAWLGKEAGKDAGNDDGAPFFAWVHLYDPHYPWHAHPELPAAADTGASYNAEVAFADSQVGRLTAYLSSRGLRERTLVIVAADHGEGLGDHGEIEHGHLLNEEVLHVPLIFSWPERLRSGHVVEAVVSLCDIFPTVAALTGLEAPRSGCRSLAAALQGRDIDSRASYAETEMPYAMFRWSPQRSLTTANWKYIRSARPELYDRRSDRAEVFNLAPAQSAQAMELEESLRDVEHAMLAAEDIEPVAMDPAARERLEALGYLGSAANPKIAARGENESGNEDEDVSPSSLAGMRRLPDIKDMLEVKHLETDLMRAVAFGVLDRDHVVKASRELVARSPASPRFQHRLAMALLEVDDGAGAEAALRRALAIDPGFTEARLALARLALVRGANKEARELFAAVLSRDPRSVEALMGLASAEAALGAVDTALGCLREAAGLAPQNVHVHQRLARTLVAAERRALAVESFERALIMNADDGMLRFDHAANLAALGRHKEALVQFRKARESSPPSADLLNDTAVTLAALGRTEEAIALYREALETTPGYARAHYNLANALVETGDYREAIAQYEAALRVRPRWEQPAERLAWLLATCEDEKHVDAERAVRMAEAVVMWTGRREPMAMATLAVSYARAGRRDDALEARRHAAALARTSGNEGIVAAVEQQLAVARGAAPE